MDRRTQMDQYPRLRRSEYIPLSGRSPQLHQKESGEAQCSGALPAGNESIFNSGHRFSHEIIWNELQYSFSFDPRKKTNSLSQWHLRKRSAQIPRLAQEDSPKHPLKLILLNHHWLFFNQCEKVFIEIETLHFAMELTQQKNLFYSNKDLSSFLFHNFLKTFSKHKYMNYKSCSHIFSIYHKE